MSESFSLKCTKRLRLLFRQVSSCRKNCESLSKRVFISSSVQPQDVTVDLDIINKKSCIKLAGGGAPSNTRPSSDHNNNRNHHTGRGFQRINNRDTNNTSVIQLYNFCVSTHLHKHTVNFEKKRGAGGYFTRPESSFVADILQYRC